MSEISNHKTKRIDDLVNLTTGFIKGENGAALFKKYQNIIDTAKPAEIIEAFDVVVDGGFDMESIKTAINKVLNLLYKAIDNYSVSNIKDNIYLNYLMANNEVLYQKLDATRPLIKTINTDKADLKSEYEQLLKLFRELQEFEKYYVIKENVLFPLVEKYLSDYRCLHIMWSFHDDIRNNLKSVLSELEKVSPDLDEFNYLSGKLFFNMLAIKFREERILFPVILEKIPEEEFSRSLNDSIEMGFPYIQPEAVDIQNTKTQINDNMIDLETGQVTPEQIKLMFNHLPVDITYVDENDEVRFFSNPPKRFFPRSKAIIGRNVQNCHPPESIDVVKKIVESFKKGEKSQASFWIRMGGAMIMIQYFAVRDENGTYRGVVEVSQEISEIQKLEGEKRLLDW